MEQNDSRVIKPSLWIPAAILALLVVVLFIGLGMKAMNVSSANGSASALYQPSVYTSTVKLDFSFPISIFTNTNTSMFLDIEARLENDMVIATQLIDLGKLPLESSKEIITKTNWTWEGIYPKGAYQAIRLRCVIPEEAYLSFSPTTALDDSGLIYNGYYTQNGTYFVGEFYSYFVDSQETSDDRGFWYYSLLPSADEAPEPTDTPISPTNTPDYPTLTPTITPWHNDCPSAPMCSPTPDQPTLTPRPPPPTEPIPTCRPVAATCPPWPTPLPTATYHPTLTPWPTQPAS